MSVKHLCRDRRCCQHQVLVGDNLGVVLACPRVSTPATYCVRLLQRVLAETVVSNIVVHHRWIPRGLFRVISCPGSGNSLKPRCGVGGADSGCIRHGPARQGSGGKKAHSGNVAEMESASQTRRGEDYVGEFLCSFDQQANSSRSNNFESCLSEFLDVSRKVPEQVLEPLTDNEFETASNTERNIVKSLDMAQPRPPKRLDQRCRQCEHDFWQPRQETPGSTSEAHSETTGEQTISVEIGIGQSISKNNPNHPTCFGILPTFGRSSSINRETMTTSFAIRRISRTWMEEAPQTERNCSPATKHVLWRTCPRAPSLRRVFGASCAAAQHFKGDALALYLVGLFATYMCSTASNQRAALQGSTVC